MMERMIRVSICNELRIGGQKTKPKTLIAMATRETPTVDKRFFIDTS
jgi:hypothetical protein